MRRFLAVLALSTLTACTTPCTPQDPCEPGDGGEGLFQASETWQRYGEARSVVYLPPPPPVAPPPPPPSFMRRHHRPSHRRLARPGANGTAQSGTAFRKVEYGGVLADRMALRPLRSFARRLHAPRSCRRFGRARVDRGAGLIRTQGTRTAMLQRHVHRAAGGFSLASSAEAVNMLTLKSRSMND